MVARKTLDKYSHKTNPLHIYCRLCGICGQKIARIVGYIYEKTLFHTIHWIIKTEIHQIAMRKERDNNDK
jgi:hypothetical protein